MTFDVAIVGGFGHVGLPLAIALARRGMRICAFDVNRSVGELIAEGRMPFIDEGADDALSAVLASGCLKLSLDARAISEADTIIVVIGTPVDRHLNPEFESMRSTIDSYREHFRDGQLIVLRSTVYPGTTEKLREWLREAGLDVELAFCPERIAEGFALKELETLPQIISSFSPAGMQRCRELFGLLTDDVIELLPIEAELAKLFNNVWRYVKFATANQFFTIANDQGADFYRIHHAMTYNYGRARDFPTPGFTAGPCLFKDAMQLAAFNNNAFYLGHAAMLVNEGLPNYIVSKLKQKHNLRALTVGILGMAFKANIDDRRESLSYKLKKILAFECRRVLCSDVYLADEDFVTADYLLDNSDVVVLGAPHREYRDMEVPRHEAQTVVDIWNVWGNGCIL